MARPILIIGAGIAGLWAALKLAPRPVILLTGSPLGEGAATCWAQGGVAAALSDDDSAGLHARDTIKAGAGLVDEAAAHALSQGAKQQVEDLAALGARFEREGDHWLLSKEAAHSRHRVARISGDGSGAAIMDVLIKAVRASNHIDIRDGWKAIELIETSENQCGGAITQTPDGSSVSFHAEHTILAMGGAGGLFATTTTPAGAQGQAMVMAARLGAVVRDPEFVQFHPTALNADLDPAPLCTEALRGEGAILVDNTGHRFMKAIHTLAELAPRDVVARSVHRQNRLGKGAFLDCREAVGNAFPKAFPAVFSACMKAGIDPRTTPIPVAPTAHYHMGGVATDLEGRTSVCGLWAIGECASSGLHGANRLASNSLAEGLVSAARLAETLQEEVVLDLDMGEAQSETRSETVGAGNLPPLALKRLRQAMSQHAGVERCEAGLRDLINLIESLQSQYGDCDALIAARFIAEGALRRTESRGGHFRTDHPTTQAHAEHTQLSLSDLSPKRKIPAYTLLPAE